MEHGVSVPPPGWKPDPAASAVQAPVPFAGHVQASAHGEQTPAEAAVRWRISAAIMDSILVTVAFLVACLLLHWEVFTIGHLAVYVLAGVAYHFVFEYYDGRTIGKRQYGIRVVNLDGTPASARAVALRSLLRLIDQLPLFYASGLVNMVRTGPAKRQRIGDVVAGTMVIAEGGYSARSGTPGWLLPAATIVAVLLSAGAAYRTATENSNPLSSAQRAEFIAGCNASPSGSVIDCGCLLTRLQAAGYDSLDDFRNLMTQIQSAAATHNLAAVPPAFIAAVEACRR